MKSSILSNKCRRIRSRLFQAVSSYIGPDSRWIQEHIAKCPKCQQRITSVGRVHLAISCIKSQPQKLDLWMRANIQTIGVLKHSLRSTPEAEKLKTVKPDLKLLEKPVKYSSAILNTAACILILFLMKAGVFSSMNKFHSNGKEVMKNYYAYNAGQDLADEIFSA